MRTLLHVDNSLRDHVGHYFNLAASLLEQAEARGVRFEALAHIETTPEVRAALPVRPVFRTDFHRGWFESPILASNPFVSRWYDMLRANIEFFRELRRGLKGADAQTTVFMPMVSHREILAWAWWLRTRPAARAPDVVLMFRLNYTDDENPEHWERIRDVASFGFRALRRLARTRRVRIATDSERLAEEYRELMGLPAEVFPIPHTEAGAAAEPAAGAATPGCSTHFVMLGDLREEKGLPLLVEALRRLHARDELAGLRFTLQSHIGSHWHEPMRDHRRALAEMGLPGVELVTTPLDVEAYYSLVDSADVVLVPYRRSTYYARTSGPVVEAFAAGKPVIATDGTWMSDQVARFGAGVTFADGDADDLARALVETRLTYHRLAERAALNRDDWLGYHNPKVFMDKLLGGTDTQGAMRGGTSALSDVAQRLVVGGMLALATERDGMDAEGLYQRPQVNWLRYHRNRLRFRRDAARTTPRMDAARVRNVLPNNGPLPVDREFTSAAEVVKVHNDPSRRRQSAEGYEGFAPDDAIFDPATESHEVWSNAEFAAVLARFAHDTYADPSVLELGCGPAHLFFFLRRYGLVDYFGIDGNPMLLDFTPHLRGHEEHFALLDLQQEIRLEEDGKPLSFDVICSFEVLEHIREDALGAYLATVHNHMHPDSVFLATASTLDTMDVHVLVREEEWWLEQFAAAGLVPDERRRALKDDLLGHPPFNWGLATTNLFALKRA